MCDLAKQLFGDILCNIQVKTILDDPSKEAAKTHCKKQKGW